MMTRIGYTPTPSRFGMAVVAGSDEPARKKLNELMADTSKGLGQSIKNAGATVGDGFFDTGKTDSKTAFRLMRQAHKAGVLKMSFDNAY